MEIALIILTGVLTGAFITAAFYLGMRYGESRQKDGAVTVTEHDIDAVKEISDWLSYGGKR